MEHQAFARYSDDDGATWESPLGPGMSNPVPFRGLLFPHGQGVGMLTRINSEKGTQWTAFDGKEWAKPAALPAKFPVQAVGAGDEIYVIDMKGPLIWYDGQAWKPLSLPGREEYARFYRSHGNNPGDPEWVTPQCFSVCGETALFVEPDKSGKKLLCWRKPKGGAWAGPQELVSEETPIWEVVAPRYSLAGFVPVAYNCWGSDQKQTEPVRNSPYSRRDLKPWIKVLKVPAR
jgi:hypothetical protein